MVKVVAEGDRELEGLRKAVPFVQNCSRETLHAQDGLNGFFLCCEPLCFESTEFLNDTVKA